MFQDRVNVGKHEIRKARKTLATHRSAERGKERSYSCPPEEARALLETKRNQLPTLGGSFVNVDDNPLAFIYGTFGGQSI